jgi:RNA polymerase sigma-70 factor (ECF subfamily)
LARRLIEKDLVDQARRTGGESLNRLCELTRDRLHTYVRRTTLDEQLVDDIVQETYIEMFNCFHKLQNPDSFWPWLRGIAYNKLRQYYQSEKRQKAILQPEVATIYLEQNGSDLSHDGSGRLMSKDMKEIILAAMNGISPKQRAIINLRCFEAMAYKDVAGLLKCTELHARVLFYRAKKALQKQLQKRGIGKGAMLSSLMMFGALTSKGSAANATVAITPAVMKVGAAPVVVAGLLSLKGGIAVLLMLALGIGVFSYNSTANDGAAAIKSGQDAALLTAVERAGEFDESWYYFPEGRDGPVLQWHSKGRPTSKSRSVQWLQNDYGNYHFEDQRAMTHNFRLWRSDLAVTRLPTDSTALLSFLDEVEGTTSPLVETVHDDQDNLMIVCRKGDRGNLETSVMHIAQASNEMYFQYGRAMDAQIIDLRDAAHNRGWSYFTIDGHLGKVEVAGYGKVPLTYSAYPENPYWLKIRLDNAVWMTDSLTGATRVSAEGDGQTYPAGHFFQGISRPWMGLHTIDTIRRDAANRQIPYSTTKQENSVFVSVALEYDNNSMSYRVTYDVDMVNDRIAAIRIESDGVEYGHLRFDYPFELDRSLVVFDPPPMRTRKASILKGGKLLVSALIDLSQQHAAVK